MQPKKEISKTVSNIKKSKSIPGEKRFSFVPFITSGSALLDLMLGGGFPPGRIVNIVGDKSTGKTLFAMECIAAAKKKLKTKLKWVYNDAEAGFAFDPVMLYGFDILADNKPTQTIEEFEMDLDNHLNKLKKDETLIYVLDCLDSLSSNAEQERAIKRRTAIRTGKDTAGTYGLEKQKMLSEFFRLQRRKIKDKNCLLIIISQVRENIGFAFGPKYKRMGGKSLDFYAAQIIWLAEVEKHLLHNRAVGITIKAKTTKNKTGLPFRECYIKMLFDYGVDDVTSNIMFMYNLLTDLGKIKKKSIIKWDEKEFTVKKLVEHIEQNNLETELEKRVQEKWNILEDSISSKDRKRRF